MSVSIAAMAATWRNVKLTELQSEMDEKATDLAAKSSESGNFAFFPVKTTSGFLKIKTSCLSF